MLCPLHHRAVHHGGWTITGSPGGEITFHPPGRSGSPPGPCDGDLEHLIAQIEADQAEQADHAGPIRVLLYSDRFDLGLAVSTHLHNDDIRRRAAEAAAGVSL